MSYIVYHIDLATTIIISNLCIISMWSIRLQNLLTYTKVNTLFIVYYVHYKLGIIK